LLGEIGMLTIVAIPLGLLLGYGLAALATAALETETNRFPLVVNPATRFRSSRGAGRGLVSSLVVRRRLDQLDLIAVLKAAD
jgi:putative ABC transport system permease protein